MSIHNHPDSAGSWINLATFHRPAQAETLKAFLESEGVTAQIHDERNPQRFWFLARRQAGIHVQVSEESLEVARQFLTASPSAKAILKNAIRCPACRSSRIQYPAMTRKNMLP